MATTSSTPTAAGPATRSAAVEAATGDLLEAFDRIQRLMQQVPSVLEEEFGIPPHRLAVLGSVNRGATRIADIAAASLASVSAASRTVDGLVKDGLLDRRPDPDDRRATRVTLTARGRALSDELDGWGRRLLASLITDLGTERALRVSQDIHVFADHVEATLAES